MTDRPVSPRLSLVTRMLLVIALVPWLGNDQGCPPARDTTDQAVQSSEQPAKPAVSIREHCNGFTKSVRNPGDLHRSEQHAGKYVYQSGRAFKEMDNFKGMERCRLALTSATVAMERYDCFVEAWATHLQPDFEGGEIRSVFLFCSRPIPPQILERMKPSWAK